MKKAWVEVPKQLGDREQDYAPGRIPKILRRFYPNFSEFVWLLDVGLKKPEREEAVRWAKSLTNTNCGWQEYEMGKYLLSRLIKEKKPE